MSDLDPTAAELPQPVSLLSSKWSKIRVDLRDAVCKYEASGNHNLNNFWDFTGGCWGGGSKITYYAWHCSGRGHDAEVLEDILDMIPGPAQVEEGFEESASSAIFPRGKSRKVGSKKKAVANDADASICKYVSLSCNKQKSSKLTNFAKTSMLSKKS